jgi:hypothetical protein
VKQKEPEIEQRRRHGLFVDEKMPFAEVQPARPHDERRRLRIERVRLAVDGVDVVDRPRHGINQIALTGNDVRPCRRGRILEVRHEHLCARIERVDDHLAVHGAGNLDAAVAQIARGRRRVPQASADVGGVDEEVQPLTSVEAGLSRASSGEQMVQRQRETVDQHADKRGGGGRQHPFDAVDDGRAGPDVPEMQRGHGGCQGHTVRQRARVVKEKTSNSLWRSKMRGRHSAWL